jgi:4-hydroxy-2-oxoheptanedioate aldolase
MHSIKQRLAQGQDVHIFSIGAIPSFKLVELVAMAGGYHGIWIDEEHAALTQRDFELLALACRSVGLDSYVRLAPLNYATIMRPMEAGINGVMAAQVRSVAEVQQVVAWAKFPPLGVRGVNPSNFEGAYATKPLQDIVEQGNRDRWFSVQIETLEALSQVRAIAAIEGVDHLFVGPADLSVALGVPGQYLHEKCKSALSAVSAACQEVGKSWGILVRSPEHASFCKSLGCQLYAFANDLAAFNQGLKTIQASYASFLVNSK